MGMETFVYGTIMSPRWKSEDSERLQRLNREVIAALPVTDDWPFLTRGMFHINHAPFPFGIYRTEMIVFGASFKEVELEWDEWLVKFDNLLRTLFWDEVCLHLRTTTGAGYWDYFYKSSDRHERMYENEPPLPVATWEFSDGTCAL